jgi:hypothetical protein
MRRSLRPIQFARMIENRFVDVESNFIDTSSTMARISGG